MITWSSRAYPTATEPIKNLSVAKNSVSFDFMNDEGGWSTLILKDNGSGQYVGSVDGYNYVGIRTASRIKGSFTGPYDGNFDVSI